MAANSPQEPFKRISVSEAKEMLDAAGVELVDVRQPGEYAAGHIHGAKLIPVDGLFERIGEVADDRDVIFYCAVGVRSALACEIGAAMGLTRCHNVEGGFEAWSGAEYPSETGAPALS